MKVYVADFNNVLVDLKARVDLVRNPRLADIFIIYNDVRGAMVELTHLAHRLDKPVLVVQHGRGACRDYLSPNNFPLIADKICVWGKTEFERMAEAGYADKTVVTGSPLINRLKELSRIPQPENFICFTPIITTHEEPDNLEVFWELKKIEYARAQKKLEIHRNKLKEGWDSWVLDPNCATEKQIKHELFIKDFYVVSKITDIHDQKLYHGQVIKTFPCNIMHLTNTFKMIPYINCSVALEEGTFQLMCAYLGIPNVVVEGFRYGTFGGVKNYKTEEIHTDSTAFCKLKDLEKTIDYETKNKHRRDKARRQVIMDELGDPDSDPIGNILNVASELCGSPVQKEELTHAC